MEKEKPDYDEKRKAAIDGFVERCDVDEEASKRFDIEAENQRLKRIAAELEENYFKTSGVPQRYFSESLETYKTTPENEKVYKWILGFVQAVKNKQNKINIIYLSGKFGTGKTHLGCGMIRALGGYIITSLELCITYDSCRDFKADMTRIQLLKKICKHKLFVIDEVGKGIPYIEKEIYPYIVNEFYGSGNLLVFLGNKSREEFIDIIGEAGADRMREVGVYLSLIGDSCRTRN